MCVCVLGGRGVKRGVKWSKEISRKREISVHETDGECYASHRNLASRLRQTAEVTTFSPRCPLSLCRFQVKLSSFE